ncbi:hypothetical protein [Streptomyces sp. NPDC004296]
MAGVQHVQVQMDVDMPGAGGGHRRDQPVRVVEGGDRQPAGAVGGPGHVV